MDSEEMSKCMMSPPNALVKPNSNNAIANKNMTP